MEPTNTNKTKADIYYIDNINPQDLYEEYIKKDKVVILKNVVKDWPAATLTLEMLQENFGDKKLRIRAGDRLNWKTLCRVKMKDYINFIRGAHDISPLDQWKNLNPYAAFNVVEGIDASVDFHSLMPDTFTHTPTILWLGPKHSLTPLHYDDSGHTFLAQIHGRKRFILYPYHETPNLYPSDLFDFMSVFSEVNIDNPDYARHPKFKQAKSIEVILNPGEIIVIPMRMWHQVEALDESLSFSCRSAEYTLPVKARHLGWYAKALLHLSNLYKQERCLCHIVPWDEDDLKIHHPVVKFLARHGGLKFHGKDLADIVGWR